MLNEIPRNSLKRLNEVLRMAKFNVSHRQVLSLPDMHNR